MSVVFRGSDGAPYPCLMGIVDGFHRHAPPVHSLMIGDSVLERVSRHDTDTRTLKEMVVETMAPKRVIALSRSAQNPELTALLLRAVGVQPRHPATIILPVNMRCFSPQWDLNPVWQMLSEKRALWRYLRGYTPRYIMPIEDVLADPEADAAFEALPIHYELSALRTVGAFQAVRRSQPTSEEERAARARELFVYHYTHRLVPEHRKLASLRECVGIAGELAARIVVYLTPINVEAGERFVGPRFREEVRANVAVVRNAVEPLLRPGDRLHDWTEAAPDSHFFHEDLATEHLNETGRRALTEKIAAA